VILIAYSLVIETRKNTRLWIIHSGQEEKMARKRTQGLTEREAEIMSILWELGKASVEDIRARLHNKPAASTVRTLLGIMVERGLVADDGSAYAKQYHSCIDQSEAQGSALRRLIDNLFAGSTEDLLVRLVDAGEVDVEQLKERLNKKTSSRES
jgi:BlaI family penicillinase repressor